MASSIRTVFAGRPALVYPREGVHWRKLLMSFSLFLQQCPAYLVHLTQMIYETSGKWPYSSSFIGCYFNDLFQTVRSILEQFPSSSIHKRFRCIKPRWCHHLRVLTQLQLKRIPVLFHQRGQISPWSITCQYSNALLMRLFTLTFSRWDIATEVNELVKKFQSLASNKEMAPSWLKHSSNRD